MRASANDVGRVQSRAEEMANAISHGVALLGSIAAIPILIVGAVRDGGAAAVVGASIFGVSLLLLYSASTIYHALSAGKAKRIFLILDHSAIYFLIAGTYTPFALGVLYGSWGWSLFGVIWALALAGVLFKALLGVRDKRLSTLLYVLMGWLVVAAVQPLMASMSVAGLLWLLAGGVFYTAGVVFFAIDGRIRYAHFVWHLFVIAGSLCHCVAVFWYST